MLWTSSRYPPNDSGGGHPPYPPPPYPPPPWPPIEGPPKLYRLFHCFPHKILINVKIYRPYCGSADRSHHSSKLDYNLRSHTDTECLLLEPAKGGKFCYFVTIAASHPLVGKGDLTGGGSLQDKKFISKMQLKPKLRFRTGGGSKFAK